MKRWIFISIGLAALLSLVGWRLYTKNQDAIIMSEQKVARSKAAPPLMVAAVVTRDIIHRYIGVGSVESPFNTKIAPKITGRVLELVKREGETVTKGEVLARIDSSELRAQVLQQKSIVAEAEARFAQAADMRNSTNVSITTQISQQQASLDSAKADADQILQNYQSQVAASESVVVDTQGRIESANAAIGNAQAGIRSSGANLDNAQVKSNRTFELYKQGYIAAQDVDDAKTLVKVQQESVEVAKGLLRSAQASHDSAVAQKLSAQKQASIVATKGKSDIRAADAKVRQAKAALEFARSNTAQKSAYLKNLESLRATVSAAQAQQQNLQAQLADTTLISPIDGFVTTRYLDPGSVASPTQPVLAILSLRQVYVTVSIPEEMSRFIHQGQTADVSFDALPGSKLKGLVTQINPAADPQSRQFNARLTLDNPGNRIKPGFFGRVSFTTERIANALVVPLESIQKSKTGSEVIIVQNITNGVGIAQHRPVKIVGEDETGIAIEGVQPGEMVVTLVNAQLKDGQSVKVAPIEKQ